MKTKYTALPLILALATVGCSVEQTNYPNFKACYKATGDANDCIEYIEQKSFDYSPTTSEPAPINPASAEQSSMVPSTGIDGSSALTGAAVGLVVPLVLEDLLGLLEPAIGAAPPVANTLLRSLELLEELFEKLLFLELLPALAKAYPATAPTAAPASKSTTSKPSLTKSSSTTRGGFGSTGSKSFGG